MIPLLDLVLVTPLGIPRESGDDPCHPHGYYKCEGVFPARAGMILVAPIRLVPFGSIPRESGDDPLSYSQRNPGRLYSPRERG